MFVAMTPPCADVTYESPFRENAAGAMVPVTCGGGKQTRVRSCTNPRPQVSKSLFPFPSIGPLG